MEQTKPGAQTPNAEPNLVADKMLQEHLQPIVERKDAPAPIIENGVTIVVGKGVLGIMLGEHLTKVEFNGTEVTSEEDMVLFVQQYIRNKVLKQFGISQVQKTPVTVGVLFMNDGNSSNLKLPAVKTTKEGLFTETLEVYYNRVRPDIAKWLGRSIQTSHITMEQVGKISA